MLAMESFPDYLQRHMDRAGWNRAELSRASSVDASLIGRWLRGEVVPAVDGARKVAEAIRRPLLEVLVAAGLITAAEAKQRTAAQADPGDLSNDELLAEIGRRMADAKPTRSDVDAHPERYTPVGSRTGQKVDTPRGRRARAR